MIVKNKTLRIILVNTISLMPGMNEVSEAQVKENKKMFDYHLEQRHIEMPKIEVENDLEDGIKQYNANDAISLIEETHDQEVLEKYLEEEKSSKPRKTVIAALNEKLEEVENALLTDKEKEDEGDLE